MEPCEPDLREAGFLGAFEERLRRLHAGIEEEFGSQEERDGKVLSRLLSMGDAAVALLASAGRQLERGKEVLAQRLVAGRRDEFGFDPLFQDLSLATFRILYHFWWRVKVGGIENVPATGPLVLLSNHSGAVLPCDAGMIIVALLDCHPARRRGRAMLSEGAPYLPGAAAIARRSGLFCPSIRGAQRILAKEQFVVGFPEGGRGAGKYPGQRRRLLPFRQYGIVSLALRTGTPVVPVAVAGGEGAYPILAKWPLKAASLPYIPVTPTFPWFGPLGLLPFPAKWSIVFGPPIEPRRSGIAGASAAEARRLGQRLRARLEAMLSVL